MDQKISILTRIHHHHSWECWEENSNYQTNSMSDPPCRSGEERSGAGERAGGNRTCLSDKQGKVKPGEVRSARELTRGPVPVVRLGAAFTGAIQGTKGQNGHSIRKGLTYGGLGGLIGGLLGAQQPFWSYQNSVGSQSEPPAVTDGMIAARRARGTRKRVMRVILKRE